LDDSKVLKVIEYEAVVFLLPCREDRLVYLPDLDELRVLEVSIEDIQLQEVVCLELLCHQRYEVKAIRAKVLFVVKHEHRRFRKRAGGPDVVQVPQGRVVSL
jgi:hypothetical protein